MSEEPSERGSGSAWEPLPDEAKAPERAWGPRLLAAGLALVVASVFVAQNRVRVETKFLFFSGEPRLWVIIVFSLVLGAILGQSLPALYRRRKGRDKDKAGKGKDMPKD